MIDNFPRRLMVLLAVTLVVGVAVRGEDLGQTRPAPAPATDEPSLPQPPQAPDPVPPTPPSLPRVAQPTPQPTTLPTPPPNLMQPTLISVPAMPRFQFPIDPKTPLKDLLPARPKPVESAGPVLVDDLTRVPEVTFEAPLANDKGQDNTRHVAHTIAKIHHANAKKPDAFVEALRADRPDLAGLPMVMGDACRTKGDRAAQFQNAVNLVQRATQGQATEVFWDQLRVIFTQEDRAVTVSDKAAQDHAVPARVAALTQMLAPALTGTRFGLAKHLATVPHVEATRALARLALFSPEDEVRAAAVEALKVRREKDYTDVLLGGLRYPWPAVAKRAADALVKLERTDLVPRLLDALDEADPRLPTTEKVDGKETAVVRELVRINHHRNCLLCHAPANAATINAGVFTAGVPVPGTPLTPPSQGYGNAHPDLLIRLDVTYLRQDFSAMQPVDDAGPWPAMQRFDFVVRTRPVTADEAKVYRDKLTPREAGEQTPYRRAVLAALRELTGKDAAPTAEAWRALLGKGG